MYTDYILLGIGIFGAIMFVLLLLRKQGLEVIRADVYRLFLEAEHKFQHGENEEKFNYVVGYARELVPFPFNLIVTEELLRVVIQSWFDVIKDLLDDGRLNNSEGE